MDVEELPSPDRGVRRFVVTVPQDEVPNSFLYDGRLPQMGDVLPGGTPCEVLLSTAATPQGDGRFVITYTYFVPEANE